MKSWESTTSTGHQAFKTVINKVICVVGCDSVRSWVDSDRGTCLHLLRGRNYFMTLYHAVYSALLLRILNKETINHSPARIRTDHFHMTVGGNMSILRSPCVVYRKQ
jgi:hypothetical protein